MILAVLFIVCVDGLFLKSEAVRELDTPYESWIGDNLPYLANKSLKQLTLPGTHDSASYNLTERYMPNSVSDIMAELIWVADHLYIPIETVIENWAISHDRTISQQLMEGIRYFDIRAGWDNETQTWRAFHLLIGNSIETILTDIKSFLDSHPYEILIIEISHFDGEPSDENIQHLQNTILQIFQNMLIPSYFPLSSSLETILSNNYRVLAAMKMRYDYDVIWHRNIWNNSMLCNTYAKTPLLDRMMVYNAEQVQNFMKGSMCLFKISWTLTPDAYTVLSAVFPWDVKSLIELADSANYHLKSFWGDLKEMNARMGNLVLFDHYQTSDYMKVVLDMNGLKE